MIVEIIEPILAWTGLGLIPFMLLVLIIVLILKG